MMGWGNIDSRWVDLRYIGRRIKTYDDAVAHWNSINPWRGESETQKRPLTMVRDRSFSILHDEKRGVVELILYNIPVITVFKNGDRLVKHEGWNSVRTGKFIDCFFSTTYSNGRQFLNLEGKHYAVSSDGVLFDKNGKYKKGAARTYNIVLNKTKTKKVMAKWNTKIKTCIAMIKLLPNNRYEEDYRYLESNSLPILSPYMEVEQILHIVTRMGSAYDYSAQKLILEADGFREKMRSILYKQEECYRQVAVPLGQIK